MQIFKVDPANPSEEQINTIVSLLKRGGIAIVPTDTVYTLAVDATNKDAIERVYALKSRDPAKPLHVVVVNLPMAEKYVELNNLAKKLAKRFLPGPLTLVLLKKKGVLPNNLTGAVRTLGIRIPNFVFNLTLASKLGRPYTTTSANLSGGPNPYSAKEAIRQLGEKVDLVLDAGELPKIAPSTIIDLTTTPPKILREGPISQSAIEAALGKKFLQTQV